MKVQLAHHFNRLVGVSTLRKNIGLTLGRQLLATFAQFMLVVLIARELGPEGNGYYAMAILVPTLLANFLNLGVGPATVYYVSRGDFNARIAVSGNLRLAVIVSVIGVAVTLPFLLAWGNEIFPGVPSALMYFGLISFPLTLALSYLNTVLQGLEDFNAFNLTVLIPPYVNLIGVVIAFYLFGLGVTGALVAYVISQLFGFLVVLLLLRQKNVVGKVWAADEARANYTRAVLGYGWKAHLSNVVTFVNYRSDIFLVNFFLTPVATGIYVIAVQISEKLWMLSQAFSTVMLPRLSAMHKTPEARTALTNKGFLIVSAITALASIGLATALWWLIAPVFGEEYLEALPAFLWLLPGVIAWAGSRIYANCIAAAGRPIWNLYVSLCVVTINIAGNVLLIPKHGIVGAAWATSVAYCFDALAKAVLVRRLD